MDRPRQVDQNEAFEMLSGGTADVYLDVRSTPEFLQGHPQGAFHVPLLEVDPASGMMQPNPDFLRVVMAAFESERRIVVGCRSGQRSDRAAALMMEHGYKDVWNVRGGFGGEHDPFGRKLGPSWVERGLPVEAGDGGDRGFPALKSRA